MECILEAMPGPDIRWFRGDTEIFETTPRYKMNRKKIAKDQYQLTLTIRAPTQEDGGQYRCNAVNPFGESNANIALNFTGKFPSLTIHVSIRSSVKVKSIPMTKFCCQWTCFFNG